jgi:lipopolysaccharide transport protein LptA
VRIFQSNLSRYLLLFILTGAFLFDALMVSWVGHANDKLPVDTDKSNRKTIHISAERLISDIKGGWAEFMGNVCLTRKSLSIKTDSLKIYYKKLTKGQKQAAPSQELIEKIIASGNVHIKSDDLVATSHKAIFIKETGIIILSGHGSKVIRKNNSIAGSEIILYMDKEYIKVKGNGTDRVKAELQGDQH